MGRVVVVFLFVNENKQKYLTHLYILYIPPLQTLLVPPMTGASIPLASPGFPGGPTIS